MLSSKDLNSSQFETVKVSKSPTTVVASNGEVLTKEEATVYVRELDLLVRVMLLKDLPAVLSLGKFCEGHGHNYHRTRSQKPHLIKNERKINCKTANFVPIVVPGLSTSSSSSSSPTSPTSVLQEAEHPAPTRSESTSGTVGVSPTHEPAEIAKRNENGDNETVWLEELTENLVDDSAREHRDAPASSSRESSSEPRGKAVSGKHSIYTHFPKNRNGEICKRTKITRAPCRRRNGEAVPRAVNFGDMITADHKVFSEKL